MFGAMIRRVFLWAAVVLTTSTIDTQMLFFSRVAALATKVARFSGRSSFEGLRISMAATSCRLRRLS